MKATHTIVAVGKSTVIVAIVARMRIGMLGCVTSWRYGSAGGLTRPGELDQAQGDQELGRSLVD
jgi:hypothetical protein